ncbi:two pore domain potassium channel family protein [Prauserella sp. PE36]|uniref:Two pore domain potassium channel family protein n=1 Tax=Prauserella endophytica TaxID=1592324 RepID=A0ABY2S7Y6_9PSEU|nr:MULTISPECIES: potassium channel family protein [Prauserella]PXY25928.1 hypothetical protein BAY59_20435 [Prauserella coralliicola]RBM24174.1 two pore domain potassium channel family protein [Prauserella sp. PE36]TKG71808.1 two pore domain potassium channel family protein [Prauserella endophytica]
MSRARSERRRQATLALFRSTCVVVALVTVYYLAPLDTTPDVTTWLWFALGLGAFGVLVTWQIRGILTAPMPVVRGVQTIAVSLPLLLVVFASVYVVISTEWPASFTERLDHSDALYFTVTVFATVGFGDIAPVSKLARLLTTAQMVVGLVAVGVVARLVVSAVRVAVQRRTNEHDDEPIRGG